MIRVGTFCLLVLGAVLWQRPAAASFDTWCEPTWTLTYDSLTACDNIGMLSPRNDTRVNLMMLMLDLRGKPLTGAAEAPTPDPFAEWPAFAYRFVAPPAQSDDETGYADGEGSRCRSNAAGTAAFVAQVNAAELPESERDTLIKARQELQPDCASAPAGGTAMTGVLDGVQSPLGRNFAIYILGTLAFYEGDYDAAKAHYATLTSAAHPWLAETAAYMLGRVEVNRAQIDAFDEYGYPKESPADPAVIDAAEARFGDYLAAYPDGAYAASARGLLRRVYWLGKRTDQLGDAYHAAFTTRSAESSLLDDVALLDEIDNKLIMPTDLATSHDPILLAVDDLRRMRGHDGGQVIERAELESQRSAFAANPALLEFLLAVHDFYIGKNPSAVIAAIPASATGSSYLDFSRQMLRGMAMEALDDAGVRDYWLAQLQRATQPMQRPAVELALAQHDERTGHVDAVFTAESLISNASIREILLLHAANATILRAQATNSAVPQHERDAALYVLLYKEVTRGLYDAFLNDLALVPADASTEGFTGGLSTSEQPPLGVFTQTTSLGDYACGPLRETAAKLAKNPKQSKALLCLADFMRVNGFDQNALDTRPDTGVLGGAPSHFSGKPYARFEVYKSLIANPKTPAKDRAYALYRAVRCYAPAQINSCGGDDVPEAQRKAWFRELKKRYPDSPWAEELRGYW